MKTEWWLTVKFWVLHAVWSIHFIPLWRKWLYFGLEDEIEKNNRWAIPFWFLEETEPYRLGRGYRFRMGRESAFHIGIAERSGAKSHADVLGNSEALGETPPEEIGKWRPPAPRSAP
jgi:hypothetical protein